MKTHIIVKKEVNVQKNKSLIITAELNNLKLSSSETKNMLIEGISELISNFGLSVEIMVDSNLLKDT